MADRGGVRRSAVAEVRAVLDRVAVAVGAAQAPRIAIARPLNVLIAPMTAGDKRPRSDDAATASTHHHIADPSSTPVTSTAGFTIPIPALNPNAAASAANERMVAGLLIVSPSVDR